MAPILIVIQPVIILQILLGLKMGSHSGDDGFRVHLFPRRGKLRFEQAAFVGLQVRSVAAPLRANTFICASIAVEDLIGSQPLGYRFLFCKNAAATVDFLRLKKSVKAIYAEELQTS